LVRHREEAEDLTQETFLRAYRFLSRYDAGRPFKNWLYTIATNVGLNALRARRRRGVSISLEASHNVAPDFPLPTHDGRYAVAHRDLQDELAGALEQLPPQPALLIHLHYHEGMSIAEAAEIAGLSEGAAKVALHRARKRLREILVETRNADL
jgi:RNA polymerase sigma-70 factor (ECF subfamily)